MIQTKQLFTQKWQYAQPLARHAWRCYLTRPDVTVEEMSKASYAAWAACNTAWNKLTSTEQNIIRAFHSGKSIRTSQQFNHRISASAEANAVTADQVREALEKAWMMWAVERGLADE